MRNTTLLAALAFIPLCASVQAENLKESAQKAIASNPEVLARWHAFEAARNERDAAAGAYLPSVNLSAGVGKDRYDFGRGAQDLNRNVTSLSLTQMVYDGFATKNEVKRLKLRATSSPI